MLTESHVSLPLAAAALWPGRKRSFSRGSLLFWQDDPVEQVHVILRGAVKVSSISPDGRVHSFGILGVGRVVGADSYLLGGIHSAVAEVMEPSELIVIPVKEFDAALANNREFATLVMRELAREAQEVAIQASELSFLHVQERLKHSLQNLAVEHGIKTTGGIRIDLNLTQEELGALVAAHRTTLAAGLSDLRRQGFLWKEGRRLVILPPGQVDLLDSITRCVMDGDDQGTVALVRRAIAGKAESLNILEALTTGMKEIDRGYGKGEIELPDVVLAAAAMKRALPIVEKNAEREGGGPSIGSVVIGTVYGDIHDIGKDIVSMLLRARRFRVLDLGVNVPPHIFADAVVKHDPDILALSAYTTMTSREIATVMRSLDRAGLRQRVRVMVGGGAVTRQYAESVGADGYHVTARGAAEVAWSLVSGGSEK